MPSIFMSLLTWFWVNAAIVIVPVKYGDGRSDQEYYIYIERTKKKDVFKDLNIDHALKRNFCTLPAKDSTKLKHVEIQMLILEIWVN